MDQHFFKVTIIAALILFSILRRVRRNIGWQKVNPNGLKARIAIFFFIGLIFLAEGALQPISLISDVVGIILGGALAYYSAVKTRFEQRDEYWYYRQSTWISGVVITIFLARFIYRLYEIYTLVNLGGLDGGQPGGFHNMDYSIGNPWTAGLMLIMFAYYGVYYIILLRNHKHLLESDRNCSH